MAEADKLMSKAESKVAVSFFKWSPDWDAALPLYEQAAQKYALSGAKDKAVVAYEKASFAQEKLGSPWHGAKHLETAGRLAKESGSSLVEVESFFKRACVLYAEAGRGQTGADALSRGAKILEDMNADAAYRLYMEAVEMYQNEGKDHYCMDTFRHAINLLIRLERFEDAAVTQLRFAEACSRAGAKQSQCKAYLGAMICWLSVAEGACLKEATACLLDCMPLEAFGPSAEAVTANELLMAYDMRDTDAIRKCCKEDSTITHLDIAVVRLARKLPVGGMESLGPPPTAAPTNQAAGGKIPLPAMDTADIDEHDLC
eukprot:CAMPEP_0198232372 /NCGR_PEP_ID=MMETSP1445-20131203/115697_1 /TAXON_ID=36898 /ORGANISM="Pyramimonas sp., Strain CCMP2087" /LENGTH=314 /DNA_ID=CAMNT_0043913043 /DNA_START=126 /DNA_END=1070 /DNA_ORIENTATION=-